MTTTREIIRKLHNEGEAVIFVDGARWFLSVEPFDILVETPTGDFSITHAIELSEELEGHTVTMEG